MPVYVVHAVGTDRYKIGYSSDVDKRINSLKTGCPYPISVITVFEGGTPEDERAIHGVYRDRRVHGEWFCLSDDTVEWMKAGQLSGYTRIIAAKFLLSKDLSGCMDESKVDAFRLTMREALDGFGQ